MTESRLQHLIVGWLKDQGAYVIKTKPQPGVPVGCPDIIGLYKSKWLAIEVKRSAKAPYRVGQEATLKHLNSQNWWVFTANPESWPEIKRTLAELFFD